MYINRTNGMVLYAVEEINSQAWRVGYRIGQTGSMGRCSQSWPMQSREGFTCRSSEGCCHHGERSTGTCWSCRIGTWREWCTSSCSKWNHPPLHPMFLQFDGCTGLENRGYAPPSSNVPCEVEKWSLCFGMTGSSLRPRNASWRISSISSTKLHWCSASYSEI